MYGHDPQHTGRSALEGPDLPQLKWRIVVAGSGLAGPPAIAADETIYIADEGENAPGGGIISSLHAIRPDGTEKWKMPLVEVPGGIPQPANPVAAIGEDVEIYVTSGARRLYSFNPDGSLRWKSEPIVGRYSIPSQAPDGTIYVGGSEFLFAIALDGTPKWQFPFVSSYQTSPAVGFEGTVFATSEVTGLDRESRMLAISSDGYMLWDIVKGALGYTPTVGIAGTVYVSTNQFAPSLGSVLAIGADGTILWETPVEGATEIAVARDGTLYVQGRYALHAVTTDGQIKWSRNIDTAGVVRHTRPAVDVKGVIYVGSRNRLLALNPEDGLIIWTFVTHQDYVIDAGPVIGEDKTIYVGSGPYLYAIDEFSPF